jgi:glycine/D-amino acid oxidase-like deaminating enzyme
MAAFIKQNEISCYWQERPSCHAYMSRGVWEEALIQVQALEKLDSEVIRNVTIMEDKASLARMRVPNAIGAIVSATAAQFWPYKLVAWVLEDLIKGRLNLQTTTPALRLEPLGHNKWAVHTSRGIIEANHIALTTNGYTSYLISELAGLIVPVKGEMSALRPPGSLVSRPCDYTYKWIGSSPDGQVHNRVQDDYLIQLPFNSETSSQGGQLLFGGAQNAASEAMIGVDDDSKVDEGAARRLRVALHEYMALDDDYSTSNREVEKNLNGSATNCLPEFQAEYEWSGIMGYSRDNFPWCGGIQGKNGLWIAAGYTGHGTNPPLAFPI